MKCVHCGYCCVLYDVIIVNPEYAEHDFDIHSPEIEVNVLFQHKPSMEACPYLYMEDNKYLCSVHDKPWYENTPCFQFSQIEDHEDCICRMGEYVRKKPELQQHILKIYNETKIKN